MILPRLFLVAPVWLGIILSQGQAADSKPEYAVDRIQESILRSAHAVVRSSHARITIVGPGRATEVIDAVITVLSKEGAENARFAVPYDRFSSVHDIQCRLYNAKGAFIRAVKSKDILDLSEAADYYSDLRSKRFGESYGIYPFTVEVHYEKRYTGYVSFPNWYPLDAPQLGCERATLEVNLAKGQGCRFKRYGIDTEPVATSSESFERYLFNVSNVPPMEYESFGPSPFEQLPYVKIVPDEFQMGDYKGSSKSWSDFGKFYGMLNAGRDVLPESCKSEVAAMVKGISDPKKKVERLYHFLQSTTRYVNIRLGIGGYQCYEAAYVYKNKYGDCKALTNYLQALLKSAGIIAYPALVNGGDEIRKIDPAFPCNEFSHVILFVPFERDTVWLECTSQESPFNFLGTFTQSRYALAILPEGGKLLQTPELGLNQYSTYKNIKLDLHEDGTGQLTIMQSTEGEDETYLNWLFNKTELKVRDEWISSQILLPGQKINRAEYVFQPDPGVFSKLVIEMEIPKCASITPKRWFLDLNVADQLKYSLASQSKRRNNVINHFPSLTADTTFFRLPPTLEVESYMRDTVRITTDFGDYISIVHVDEKANTIQYIRQLILFAFDFPPLRYEELRSFISGIVKADRSQAILVRK